jgi:hypothetical protein
MTTPNTERRDEFIPYGEALTEEQVKVIQEFSRTMEEEVIPKIVEVIRERARLAQESRKWFIAMQTEQTMHNAWRKRAEEAERQQPAAPNTERLREALRAEAAYWNDVANSKPSSFENATAADAFRFCYQGVHRILAALEPAPTEPSGALPAKEWTEIMVEEGVMGAPVQQVEVWFDEPPTQGANKATITELAPTVQQAGEVADSEQMALEDRQTIEQIATLCFKAGLATPDGSVLPMIKQLLARPEALDRLEQQVEQLWNEQAGDGWTGDAVCVGEEFKDAVLAAIRKEKERK